MRKLEHIEDDLRAASPGPWRVSMTGHSVKDADGRIVCQIPGSTPLGSLDQWLHDANLIAAARTDLPEALAEVRMLRTMLAEAAYLLDTSLWSACELRRRIRSVLGDS